MDNFLTLLYWELFKNRQEIKRLRNLHDSDTENDKTRID